MVFCDEPWYNEPGREVQPNKAQSLAYNAVIRSYTVQHAMNHWLTQTATNGVFSVWADVVDKHFSAKAKPILTAVEAWSVGNTAVTAQLTTLRNGLSKYLA